MQRRIWIALKHSWSSPVHNPKPSRLTLPCKNQRKEIFCARTASSIWLLRPVSCWALRDPHPTAAGMWVYYSSSAFYCNFLLHLCRSRSWEKSAKSLSLAISSCFLQPSLVDTDKVQMEYANTPACQVKLNFSMYLSQIVDLPEWAWQCIQQCLLCLYCG